MKTKLIAVLAIVLCTQTAFAQFTAGTKLGANLNKVQGQPFSSGFNTGYLAGGFAIVSLGKKVSIQPEVLFNQSATKADTSLKQVTSDAFSSFRSGNVKLNYLSVPILVNYNIIGKVVSLQAGPQVGILINQNDNLLKNGENAFKNGEFSMVGGAQVKVTKVVVSARYVVGLNNISDIGTSSKWKNQAWQLSVGWAFL